MWEVRSSLRVRAAPTACPGTPGLGAVRGTGGLLWGWVRPQLPFPPSWPRYTRHEPRGEVNLYYRVSQTLRKPQQVEASSCQVLEEPRAAEPSVLPLQRRPCPAG